MATFNNILMHTPIQSSPVKSIVAYLAKLNEEVVVMSRYQIRGHIESVIAAEGNHSKWDQQPDDKPPFCFLFEIKILKIIRILFYFYKKRERARILSLTPVYTLPLQI